jgi:hypothetical protein
MGFSPLSDVCLNTCKKLTFAFAHNFARKAHNQSVNAKNP